MASPHIKSKLSLSKIPVPISPDTSMLCHYDLTTTSFNGIAPTADASFLTGLNQRLIINNGKVSAGYEGKYGGAAIIAESTTNLLYSQFNDTDFETTTVSNSTWTVSVVNDPEARNGKCLEITALVDVDSWPGPIQINGVAASTSTAYTFSIRYKIINCQDNTAGQYSRNQIAVWSHWTTTGSEVPDDYVLWNANSQGASSSTWLTYSTTTTSPSTATGKWFRVGTGAVKAGTKFRVDWIQFEQKAYPTYFTNSSRASDGYITYPQYVLNQSEGTVSAWFASTYDYMAMASGTGRGQGDRCIFYTEHGWSANQGFFVYINDGNQPCAIMNGVSTLDTTKTWKAYEWHMATLSWSASRNYFKLYIDGNPVGSVNAFQSAWTVGNLRVGMVTSNFLIDELRVDRVSRTDEEILSWYISQCPFYVKERYKLVR